MEKKEQLFFQEVFEYPIKGFKTHLEEQNNCRILFSGKFGIGKTSFLKKFFEKEHQLKQFGSCKYIAYHLYPVNYSVSSNEDIIRYIKYDIIWGLLKNNSVIDETSITFGESLKKYFEKNMHRVLASLVYMIPKIGKDVYEAFKILDSIKDEFLKFHQKERETDGDKLIDYMKVIENDANSIYETDLITDIILDTIKQNKNEEQKSILIIDDLDRLDPEHVFRILNVFAAHFDYEIQGRLNKFDFDQVIFVCDFNNIRNIYHHKYGSNVDFMGYIDKFYTSEIFHFDNKNAIKKIIHKLYEYTLFNLKEDAKSDEPLLKKFYFGNSFLINILTLFVERNFVSLRNLINLTNKIISYHYEEIEISPRDFVHGWKIPIAMQLKLLRFILGDNFNLLSIFKNCETKKFYIEDFDIYFGSCIYILSAELNTFRRDSEYEFAYNNINLKVKTKFGFVNGQLEDVSILDPKQETSFFNITIDLFWKALIDATSKLESVGYLN